MSLTYHTHSIDAFVLHRAMILIFTSTAFTDWVKSHVEATENATFNPYLSFLFIAMAGLSAVRFVGSTLYLLLRLIGF